MWVIVLESATVQCLPWIRTCLSSSRERVGSSVVGFQVSSIDGDVMDSREAPDFRLAEVLFEFEDVQALLLQGVLQDHFELRGRGVRVDPSGCESDIQ